MLSEFARVAGKFILVTVPNGENLEKNATVCGACRTHFHIWVRLPVYTAELTERLFLGFNSN
jgi:hypothetical protein